MSVSLCKNEDDECCVCTHRKVSKCTVELGLLRLLTNYRLSLSMNDESVPCREHETVFFHWCSNLLTPPMVLRSDLTSPTRRSTYTRCTDRRRRRRAADLLLSCTCMLATSNSCPLSNRGVLYSHAATWSTDATMLSPKKSKWTSVKIICV